MQFDSNNECNCRPEDRYINCTLNTYYCCTCRRRWEWIDGSISTFTNWMYDEPSGGQGCARISKAQQIHPVTEGLFWFDNNCNSLSRFICKREKGNHYYIFTISTIYH